MKDAIKYLACPYTHPDREVKEERFQAVTFAAAQLFAVGVKVFSPITQSHPISVMHGLPESWEFWEEYDTRILSICDELLVLQLDGWDRSKGVRAEIRIAQELGIPVRYFTPQEVSDYCWMLREIQAHKVRA